MSETEKRGRGRPKGSGLVITAEKKREIFAILSIGASRNDAADYIGVGRTTLHDLIEKDEDFAEQVKKAESAGKIKHMKKVGNAPAWQASAWMLERKWPKEFGAKQQLEHTGADGGPIEFAKIERVIVDGGK